MNRSAEPQPATQTSFFRPCWTLCHREIVRFARQRSRVIGALGTPLVFWLLVGFGLGRSFRLPGTDSSISYLEYSYPGAIAAILLFTAIFSMISIIDDRREGFMQGVLVAPVARSSIVLGKVFGATTLAVAQAAIFLFLAPVAGIPLSFTAVVATLAAMTLVALALTGLGFWMAWLMDSVQGFHAIMNVVLMPMLIISGAFFPPSGSGKLLQWVMAANPMTYAVALLRWAIFAGAGPDTAGDRISLPMALGVTTLFGAATLGLSIHAATRKASKALQ